MAISDLWKRWKASSSNAAAGEWIDPFRTLAAAGALLFGAALAAGMLISLGVAPAAEDAAARIVLLLLGVVAATTGAVLGFGSAPARKQAFWILLVYGLFLAVAGAIQAFAALLWDGWKLLPVWPIGSHILTAGQIILGGGIAALLFRASPPATRQRYGANVAASVAAVIAVVVVLNLLSFSAPLEHDFQTLGMFGLSERSRKIIGAVETPLQIYAVYTDARLAANTPQERQSRDTARKRLERVMELLEDMHRVNPRIEGKDASSDAARANLMSELRALQRSKTGDQETLLQKVRREIPAILKELDSLRNQWSRLGGDSYLAQWDVGGAMADVLADRAEKLEEVERQVAQAVADSPLPDSVSLLKKLVEELRSTREILQTNGDILKRLGKLPATVRANAPRAIRSIEESRRAVQDLQNVLRAGGPNGPGDPARALKELAAATAKARQAVQDAAKALENIAGDDPQDVRLVSVSRAWQVDVPSRRFEGMIERTTRGRLFRDLADDLEALRAQTAVLLTDANETAQRRFLLEMRPQADKLAEGMKKYQSAVEEGLARLTTVDDRTRTLLAAAEEGKAFASLTEKISPLLEAYDKLKSPKDDALPPDLSGKNILVLRSGEKVEVVSFDETWPSRAESEGVRTDDTDSGRFFNGDAVLASRILAMTKKRPFGRVLIAYLEPTFPPELSMRLRPPQGDIPPSQLTEVTKRLKEAGFQVQNWNLREDMPAPEPEEKDSASTRPATRPASGDSLPTILLVVPPAPPLPPMGPGQPPSSGFGPEHLQKIRDAVDDGAAALFLLCHLRPQMMGFGMALPQKYAFAEYLREVWGLEARPEHMIVEGIPTQTPGKYQINPVRTSYLPLSSFSAHPIGKPLQGRRMIWSASCPITLVSEAPKGVQRAEILTIPETMTNVWAAGDIQKLAEEIEQSRGGLVRPRYEDSDLKVPLALAVAAVREGDMSRGIAPSRLVILGVGLSLTDAFLTNPIPQLTDQGGYEAAPPPRDNLDLLVNAAYWLIGKETYIAAGPTNVQPVRAMTPATQTTIWTFCVLVLPLAVLIAGVLVLRARKRS